MIKVEITYCVPLGVLLNRNLSWDRVWLPADDLIQAIARYGNGFEIESIWLAPGEGDKIWIAPGAILQMKMKD